VRRRRASRKPAKAQQRTKAKRGTGSKPAGNRRVSAVGKTTKAARLARELREARQQHAATAEILRVIAGTPADVRPVFDAIVANAARLCDAAFSAVATFEGGLLQLVAVNKMSPEETAAYHTVFPRPPGRHFIMGRAFVDRRPVHIADIEADPDYDPRTLATLKAAAPYHTFLGIPILRDGVPIGAIGCGRREVRPFTEAQIALVQAFADQAVIAIENARLLNELRQRTTDLTESLEQQTATSEVLRVISSSPTNVQPVLATIVRAAVSLCNSYDAVILLREGEHLRIAAHHGPMALDFKWLPLGRDFVSGRTVIDGVPVHVPDFMAAGSEFPRGREVAKRLKQRTVLGLPLKREDQTIGCLFLRRTEVLPFTDKQIELLTTFADQAVIAIENVRLFEAEQQRTRELSESLEQQTATSEVLRVISSTPGELEAVFQVILENAVRLCEASFGMLFRFEEGAWRAVAMLGVPPAFADFWRRGPLQVGPRTGLGRIAATRQTVHFTDVTSEPAEPVFLAAIKLGGFRTAVGVPILNDENLIGAIFIYRQEMQPFSDKQIALVTNFAAQAIIAIENTRLLNDLRQRTDDLTESLEQQTATSEVLQVISKSQTTVQPVLDTVVESAARLCEALSASIYLRDGDVVVPYAHSGPLGGQPLGQRLPLNANWVTGRAVLEARSIHVPNLGTSDEYPQGRRDALRYGHRATLAVPLLREGTAIGNILVRRREDRPFTDKQIELVQNFAAQAVIAIENTRLLNELRESLQQQTATADVLRVISSSPGELEPVFQNLLDNATRLCVADFGLIFECKGNVFQLMAQLGADQAYVEYLQREPFHPGPETLTGRVLQARGPVQIEDFAKSKGYFDRDPLAVVAVEQGGVRTTLGVPLLKENELIGVIALYRQEVRLFTDKQIELLENFAAQAVIAIENTRLLNELRQRTDNLTESLNQQTATSEILRVISSSRTDLQPVFDTIVASAVRLCGARMGAVFRFDGKLIHLVAHHNYTPEVLEVLHRTHPRPPQPDQVSGRVILTGAVAQVGDVLADPNYLIHEIARAGNWGSILGVPMLRADAPIGVIVITRNEQGPFPTGHIKLLKAFADQAVIAIENVRLFDEVQARTQELARSVEELKALGEVGEAVNSTLDVETVLRTIVTKAVELSVTDAGAIYVFDEDHREFHLRATYGMSEAMIAAITDRHIGMGDANMGEAARRREPIQIADLREAPASGLNDLILGSGYRALLVVPLLGPDRIVGALVVRRKEPGEFAKNTVELLQTFAAQSALAIQNARLFDNAESRTRELARSLSDLRTAQDRLVQTQKLASLGQLTAGIAHEIKNPLNFVNNFSGVSVELIDELEETLGRVTADDKTRAEIIELADTLRNNLDKIAQHGKRADSIVKNMLLHSREGSGERRLIDVNALVEESLNLAYHGARAEKQGFNVTLQRSFDPSAGEVEAFPQEISRVLLNLISNGFYAATKRQGQESGNGFEPTITAATKNLGDRVEIRIRDNGTGVPSEVREKMFNPFFTTKPAGEGTGLGLSLSHDIIVKQHSGSIEVDTEPGAFTEFRIVLPRTAAKPSPQ
jgi:GAF domain-containing protein